MHIDFTKTTLEHKVWWLVGLFLMTNMSTSKTLIKQCCPRQEETQNAHPQKTEPKPVTAEHALQATRTQGELLALQDLFAAGILAIPEETTAL